MDEWLLLMLNDTIMTCIEMHFLFWVIHVDVYHLLIKIIVYFLRFRSIFIKLGDSAVICLKSIFYLENFVMCYNCIFSVTIVYYNQIKFKGNFIYLVLYIYTHSKLIYINDKFNLFLSSRWIRWFNFLIKGIFINTCMLVHVTENLRNYFNWIVLLHNNECLVWMKSDVIPWIIW